MKLDIFNSEYKEDPIVLHQDPLSLSACLKRIRDNDSNSYYRIQDKNLIAHLQEEDSDLSNKIKDYYKKKVLLETLKTSYLSDFRKNLIRILDSQTNSYTSKEIGMLVSLPYFYEEDLLLDALKEKLDINTVKRVTPNLVKHDFTLKLEGTSKRFINKKPQKRFWFSNNLNQPCLIMLENNNTLLNFFESYISVNDKITLQANATAEFNPIPHIKLFNFSLVK